MTSVKTNHGPQTYQNPVFAHSFPDPFVLKHGNSYFAYCTGHWTDGKVFGVLHSNDLINWTPVGGAMEPVNDPAPFYWAPEITYENGLYYLYYSMGNEALMHLRVATSDRPDGGFVDTGRRLTDVDFAIDAHVFRDDDGQDYMFYAVDFLDHSHIGTGIVVDRMTDRFTLEGSPRTVVRAKYDWQVYDPARKEKGGVRWHTVEGPFVFKRKGKYYVMFSGGNWQNPTYGVSFAATDSLDRSGEWDQFCDGSEVLPILRTYPGQLAGPGHNSVIRGLNNRELYCVYHYWFDGQRVLALNRLDIAGGRLMIESSPYLPKSLPYFPQTAAIAGDASVRKTIREISLRSSSFLFEVNFHINGPLTAGKFGIKLTDGMQTIGEIEFETNIETVSAKLLGKGPENAELPFPGLWPEAQNLLRLEVDGQWCEIQVNSRRRFVGTPFLSRPRTISFYSDGVDVAWSGLAITEGFDNDLDPGRGRRLDESEWTISPAGTITMTDGGFTLTSETHSESLLEKEVPWTNFEFAATVRSAAPLDDGSFYGFILKSGRRTPIKLEIADELFGFVLADRSHSLKFDLPAGFRPEVYHQFKFEKKDDVLSVFLDLADIGFAAVPVDCNSVGIICSNLTAAVDMVRLTAID